MLPIDRARLVRQLRRLDPSSPLASHLETAPKRQLSRERLDKWVERYRTQGHELRATEQRALQQVYAVMSAPGLFGETEPGESSLALLAQAKTGPGPKRRQGSVLPAFSSVGSPRLCSGTDPLKGRRLDWSVELGDAAAGMPVQSPDATVLYVHDSSGNILAMEAATGRELWTYELGRSGATSMALHPDGRRLFTLCGMNKAELVVIDTESRQVEWKVALSTPEANANWSAPVVLSPDGRRVFTRDSQCGLSAFDADTGECLWSRRLRMSGYFGNSSHELLAVSPDGKTVVASDGRRTLFACDPETGKELWRAEQEGELGGGVMSADGALVVAACGSHIRAFDLEDGSTKWEVKAPDFTLSQEVAPALTGDGTAVVVYDGDAALLLLEVGTGETRRRVELPPELGDAVLWGAPALLAGDGMAVVADEDGNFWAVDFVKGTSWKAGEGEPVGVDFALSPDGRFAYHGSDKDRSLEAVALKLSPG